MIKKILCSVLSAQMILLPVAFADKKSEDRKPASSAADLDYMRTRILRIVAGRPGLKYLSKDKKETTADEILKGSQEFYLTEGGPIYGFKTTNKNGAMSIALSAYDSNFNLVDGRSVTIDPDLSAGQNLVSLESAEQSLANSVRQHGLAERKAAGRSVANDKQEAAGWIIAVGCVTAFAGGIMWAAAAESGASEWGRKAGRAGYIGLGIAVLGGLLYYFASDGGNSNK